MVGGGLFMLGVALAASLPGGGGLLEVLLILVVVLVPAGVFALATRLPKRVLGMAIAVTLAGSMLPLVLPRDAMGGGPVTFATPAGNWRALGYLGVLVVFLGLALEGLRRFLRSDRSRGSG